MRDPSRGKRASVSDVDTGPEPERRDHRRTLTTGKTPLRNGASVGGLRRRDDVSGARCRGRTTRSGRRGRRSDGAARSSDGSHRPRPRAQAHAPAEPVALRRHITRREPLARLRRCCLLAAPTRRNRDRYDAAPNQQRRNGSHHGYALSPASAPALSLAAASGVPVELRAGLEYLESAYRRCATAPSSPQSAPRSGWFGL